MMTAKISIRVFHKKYYSTKPQERVYNKKLKSHELDFPMSRLLLGFADWNMKTLNENKIYIMYVCVYIYGSHWPNKCEVTYKKILRPKENNF